MIVAMLIAVLIVFTIGANSVIADLKVREATESEINCLTTR